jgi:chemotaxis response regulator CheB
VQPDMPESAIASGCIDFVLSPEDIAKEIVRIAHADKIGAKVFHETLTRS